MNQLSLFSVEEQLKQQKLYFVADLGKNLTPVLKSYLRIQQQQDFLNRMAVLVALLVGVANNKNLEIFLL